MAFILFRYVYSLPLNAFVVALASLRMYLSLALPDSRRNPALLDVSVVRGGRGGSGAEETYGRVCGHAALTGAADCLIYSSHGSWLPEG